MHELHVVDYYEGESCAAFEAAALGADVPDGAGSVVGVERHPMQTAGGFDQPCPYLCRVPPFPYRWW